MHNAHEIFNLGARKKESIEDSFNTEKNRGYHYTHAYSYNWNAMQGFHLLMRLGHAINALSAFTKELKRFMKEQGYSAVLKRLRKLFLILGLPMSGTLNNIKNHLSLGFKWNKLAIDIKNA